MRPGPVSSSRRRTDEAGSARECASHPAPPFRPERHIDSRPASGLAPLRGWRRPQRPRSVRHRTSRCPRRASPHPRIRSARPARVPIVARSAGGPGPTGPGPATAATPTPGPARPDPAANPTDRLDPTVRARQHTRAEGLRFIPRPILVSPPAALPLLVSTHCACLQDPRDSYWRSMTRLLIWTHDKDMFVQNLVLTPIEAGRSNAVLRTLGMTSPRIGATGNCFAITYWLSLRAC